MIELIWVSFVAFSLGWFLRRPFHRTIINLETSCGIRALDDAVKHIPDTTPHLILKDDIARARSCFIDIRLYVLKKGWKS